MTLKDKITDCLKNCEWAKKMNFNKFIFWFLFKIKKDSSQFKVKIQTKCLVLSHYIGAETRALGGLIAQYPKNFEILALTNGSSLVKNVSQIESINIKKQQFYDVMKLARVKGFKVFDINCGTLKDEFNKFRKIDISEADYIFVPNIFDPNPDVKALLEHFKKILKTKEHKKELRILMYESDYALTYADCYANASNICETKRQMLKIYYPLKDEENIIQGVLGLNKFRALPFDVDFAEGFTEFSVEEFLKIPFL